VVFARDVGDQVQVSGQTLSGEPMEDIRRLQIGEAAGILRQGQAGQAEALWDSRLRGPLQVLEESTNWAQIQSGSCHQLGQDQESPLVLQQSLKRLMGHPQSPRLVRQNKKAVCVQDGQRG